MAIEKYTTEGIILESYDQGEHDRAYKVFTREFGLLICHGKSIRKLESKLRAHVLPRTIALLTLVKGKEVWRLVGGEGKVARHDYLQEVVLLLKRFVQGGGAHLTLYDRITSFLEEAHLYKREEARLLLYFIILVELGYADAKVLGVKSIENYRAYSISDLYTHLLLAKPAVKAHMKEVLAETHL